MKNIHIVIACLIFFMNSCQAQQNREIIEFTGSVSDDLEKYFTETTVVADIIDGIKQDPRQVELGAKFRMAISENHEWFITYISSHPKGKPVPYHENFGITESEYIEFQQYAENIEVLSTGQETLIIEKQDSVISFRSEGKLSIYEEIEIHLNNNTVYFKDYELELVEQVIIDDANNGMRSKWKGYNWVFERPTDLENEEILDLKSLSATQVKFTIGQLERDGLIYLQIKERVLENGQNKINTQVPILF